MAQFAKQVLLSVGLVAILGGPAVALAASASAKATPVADFTGHWVGKGKMKSTFGMNSDCDIIDVTIKQTATDFVIENYHSKCGMDDSTWGPNTMHIQGADVIENDEKVGAIDDSTFQSASPDTGVVYLFNMKKLTKPDGTTIVDCQYGTQNAVDTIAIEGQLTKQ